MIQKIKTQVGIIGAGPSGLLLGQMLHNRGIDAVIIESRSRDYVQARVRAGVQEQTTVDTFVAEGVGKNLLSNRMVHQGVYLHFNNEKHYLNAEELTGGKVITVYGQRNIVCDMIDCREKIGLTLLFEAKANKIVNIQDRVSQIHFKHQGEEKLIECDFVAGCDGFHGVSRNHIPEQARTIYQRTFPYSWLGILAEAPPACSENIYAHSAHGFALQSMRSPQLSRLYIQVPPEEDLNQWSADAFFDAFENRIGAGYKVNRGKVINKSIAHMKAFVTDPMQYGNLYLAGDAAHIVPPTGAKGMNLSIADVKILGEAIHSFYRNNKTSKLENYSQTCLRRIWKVERFSWWFTTTLHLAPNQTEYDTKMQIATLNYIVDSKVGAHSLVENYVGLPLAENSN